MRIAQGKTFHKPEADTKKKAAGVSGGFLCAERLLNQVVFDDLRSYKDQQLASLVNVLSAFEKAT
nr:hypothetical protein [Marinobacter shengliensis]